MDMKLNLTFEDGVKVHDALVQLAIENERNSDAIVEYARVLDVALAAIGIEIKVNPTPSTPYEEDDFDEEDFEDEDEDEEEEEYDSDTCRFSLTPKGNFVIQYMEAGHSFEEACEIADILFNEDGE